MRRAIVGLVVSIAIVIATLLLLEGSASTLLLLSDYLKPRASRARANSPTTHDTLLGWVNKPEFSSPDEYGAGVALSIATDGVRSTKLTSPAPGNGVTRITCSGDSFTLGVGVGDGHQWCAALAAFFANVETIDAGQPAYGLDQTYLWHKRDGVRFASQIQLLALTDGQLDRTIPGNSGGLFKPYLAIAGSQLVAKGVPVPTQTDEAVRRATAARSFEGLRIMQALRRIPAFDERRAQSRRIDRQWPLFERILDEFAALDKSAQSTLILAYLPVLRDLKPSDLDERRQRVADYARQHDIPFIDLTAAMRSLRPDSLDLAFISKVPPGASAGMTGQYSNLGNAWIARALAERLAAIPSLQPLLTMRHPE